MPSQEILAKVVRLAVDGHFPFAISRTAPMSEAIALIGDLETGKCGGGKTLIFMKQALA